MKHIYAGFIVPSAPVIPVGVGICKRLYRKAGLDIILYYLVFAMTINITERFIGQRHINNLPLLHFYTLLEGILILGYFKIVLNQCFKKLIKVLCTIFILFTLIDLALLNSIYEFNSYARSVGAFFIIICCVLHLYDGGLNERWINNPFYWITAGMLLYFTSSLIYFGLLNFIAAHATDFMWYLIQNIHASLVLSMYILITAGFVRTSVKSE